MQVPGLAPGAFLFEHQARAVPAGRNGSLIGAEPFPQTVMIPFEWLGAPASSAPQVAYPLCPMGVHPVWLAKVTPCSRDRDMRKAPTTVPISL